MTSYESSYPSSLIVGKRQSSLISEGIFAVIPLANSTRWASISFLLSELDSGFESMLESTLGLILSALEKLLLERLQPKVDKRAVHVKKVNIIFLLTRLY